jgi:hypothetical protein
MNKILATAALLATLVASPAFAQSYDPDVGTGNIAQYSTTAPTPGTGIYLRADDAAAPLGGAASVRSHGSDARATSLRECSDVGRRYLDTTWGLMSAQLYRSCMAQHGQAE